VRTKKTTNGMRGREMFLRGDRDFVGDKAMEIEKIVIDHSFDHKRTAEDKRDVLVGRLSWKDHLLRFAMPDPAGAVGGIEVGDGSILCEALA
jgi:hypothetical protein